MSAFVIINGLDPRLHGTDFFSQVKDIFFESSQKKQFADEKEKEAFAWKYLDFYKVHYPEYLWIALNQNKVLGYVLGMPFTKDSALYDIQPHLKKFEKFFDSYPAHLHINCHHESRGRGVGAQLIQHFLGHYQVEGIKGVHIITGSDARNRFFYRNLGFSFEYNLEGLCFMGKNL